MNPLPPPGQDVRPPETPTLEGIAVLYMLLFVVLGTLWAISYPAHAALVAAGAVGGIVAILGLLNVVSVLRRGDTTYVRVPLTRVRVEF